MAVKIDKGSSAGLIILTPMIDIVFQMLLFFLVASKFADAERELKLTLPSATEAKPLVVKPNIYYVNVDQSGQYQADGKMVTPAQLEEQLAQLAANNPGRQTVKIRADKRSPWQSVLGVMNLCKKVNIRDYQPMVADPSQG